MTTPITTNCDRRGFLAGFVPVCSLACLAAGDLLASTAPGEADAADKNLHKFDVPFSTKTTPRKQIVRQNRSFIGFIKTLQKQMDEKELIRLLKLYSTDVGREVGARQAQNAPDTTLQTYVKIFRPPNYAGLLTHEIVTDTEKTFELRVTECVWSSVFSDAGIGGEIGHAAICNMDYYWPQAFNKNFKMERSKTLMQGHNCCNHRYVDTT